MPKITKKTSKKASPLLEADENGSTKGEQEEQTTVPHRLDGSTLQDPSIPVREYKKDFPSVQKKKDAQVAPKANITDDMKSDKESTRQALAKDEQVHFMIPLALGEKAGAVEDVWINGFHTQVPKGVMSVIPKSVAELLANKYQVEATVGSEFRLDLNPDKSDKVS